MKSLLGLLFFLSVPLLIVAQPFQCDGDFILSLTSQGPSTFYKLRISPNGSVLFDPLPAPNSGKIVNAIGYRITDNYIYGVEPNSHELYRIDASGVAVYLTTLALTPQTVYWAGAITPDGDDLLLLGKRNGWLCTCDFARVDLNDYSVAIDILPNVFPSNVTITDIAFSPITGELFGFDRVDNRLVKINPASGEVDETTYPPSSDIEGLGALFFDSFGDIYGYGNQRNTMEANTLFKIDINTGAVIWEAIGQETVGQDGCACSNNVDLRKYVEPESAFPCEEVVYIFEIANASRGPQFNTTFTDELPVGFTITEILDNPYGGNIVSGVGTNVLTITNMDLFQGIDSIKVKVMVGANSKGLVYNQAKIENLPSSLGFEALSDDPNTFSIDDSTVLEVLPLEAILPYDTIGICNKDTVVLDATTPGVTYLWEDGSTNAVRQITEIGLYMVTITAGCTSASDSVMVIDESLQLDLGPNIEIKLGDSILLIPNLVNYSEIMYHWTDPLGNSLRCPTCPSTIVAPYSNVTYSLDVVDAFGCTDSDNINIDVIVDRNLFMPNVFSPNFDGVNDVLYAQGDGNTEMGTFRVFNRWGGVVFEQTGGTINDYNRGWDGTNNGKKLNSGVYLYYIEVNFPDGEVVILSGDIMLVR